MYDITEKGNGFKCNLLDTIGSTQYGHESFMVEKNKALNKISNLTNRVGKMKGIFEPECAVCKSTLVLQNAKT